MKYGVIQPIRFIKQQNTCKYCNEAPVLYARTRFSYKTCTFNNDRVIGVILRARPYNINYYLSRQ